MKSSKLAPHLRRPGDSVRSLAAAALAVRQQLDDSNHRWDELPVEVYESHGTLQLLHCRQFGKVCNRLLMAGQWRHSRSCHSVAHKINCSGTKNALSVIPQS